MSGLEIITATGLDDKTDLIRASDMSDRFTRLEFGILVGSRTGHEPKFPSLPRIDKAKAAGLRISIHLCGNYARGFMGIGAIPHDLWDIISGAVRVQVNSRNYDATYPRFRNMIRDFGKPVILQHRSKSWNNVPFDKRFNVEYLFDRSGGRGIVSHTYPRPPQYGRVGYAGGLPNERALMAIKALLYENPRARIWVDAESKLRDLNNRFDLNKVAAFCQEM